MNSEPTKSDSRDYNLTQTRLLVAASILISTSLIATAITMEIIPADISMLLGLTVLCILELLQIFTYVPSKLFLLGRCFLISVIFFGPMTIGNEIHIYLSWREIPFFIHNPTSYYRPVVLVLLLGLMAGILDLMILYFVRKYVSKARDVKQSLLNSHEYRRRLSFLSLSTPAICLCYLVNRCLALNGYHYRPTRQIWSPEKFEFITSILISTDILFIVIILIVLCYVVIITWSTWRKAGLQ